MIRAYSEPGDHYSLIEDLEDSGQLQDYPKILKFSSACCHLIRRKLPAIAREALKIANKFSEGELTGRDLEAERVKLWTILGKDSCDFSSPTVNGIRAVICCLYENEDLDHAYENVRAVMDFCNAVDNYEEEQFKLLLEIFDTPQ